ncbi:hypothetical protein F2Q69_00046839 [Brassica cretica]|uniref:Uncharacterized protein n=1 Tax=Brassica cretica TaxID=69181 RepID=A0A8S9PPS1_BRACR|nr:hypothetical protein F2Q69_00046839 [Brassica cretica]
MQRCSIKKRNTLKEQGYLSNKAWDNWEDLLGRDETIQRIMLLLKDHVTPEGSCCVLDVTGMTELRMDGHPLNIRRWRP